MILLMSARHKTSFWAYGTVLFSYAEELKSKKITYHEIMHWAQVQDLGVQAKPEYFGL